MLTYFFPGQGSQVRGMGAHLFDEFPELTSKADAILGYSIKTLCLEDPQQQLNQTQYTQSAIFIISALSYLKKQQETQQKPDYVAGHSLGEYSALFAAQVFDFETGLQLIKKRGELMSQATGGGMAAVIGLTADKIKNMLEKNNLSTITIANYNSYLQLILSGPKIDIERAQEIFKNTPDNHFIPLKVSGAFHSSYMQSAQEKFSEFLNNFTFSIPTIPVLANINAKPYHPAVIKNNLTNQLTQPVQWTNIIKYLLTQSNNQDNQVICEEIGPGNILTGLLRRIREKI